MAESRAMNHPVGSSSADDRTMMLLFRAGGVEPKSVPLGLVARLEEFSAEQIEFSSEMQQYVTERRTLRIATM
jgi:two-component system chemotaxis sensor kinase CheA